VDVSSAFSQLEGKTNERHVREAGEGEADVELDIDGDDDLSEGRNMDVNVPSVSSYAGLSGEANENVTYLRTFPSST
jgi:hypothetical protein